ncbi:MAG: ABC transporter substrate-binding protein [Bacteroidota bacterium]|jgi:NitT/TauT family transport system substrate-binding protein
MRKFSMTLAMAAVLGTAGGTAARAEVKEVVLGQQFGAVYLTMMVMQHEKMVEKQLAKAGLDGVTVNWARLGGPAALNDAIISGSLHFAAQGAPSMIVLWDRTRNSVGFKAAAAIANNNIWLHTKNPNIKSLRDFTEKDRIAVPSLKVSTQAFMLQYAADKEWGKATQLDYITVALAHPDALAAVLNPVGEITAHFATSPFHEKEVKAGLPSVITAYDIMGGPTTGLTFTSTEKFRSENPKTYAAVLAAYDEAIEWVNSDKLRAARLYIEVAKDKNMTDQELAALMSTKDLEFTKVPSNVGKMADFLHRTGAIKNKAASWKDLFFPEVHGLPGS